MSNRMKTAAEECEGGVNETESEGERGEEARKHRQSTRVVNYE
jgi:hypothetical protein